MDDQPALAFAGIPGQVSKAWLEFIIKDIRAAERTAENLANPLAPLLYGFSVIYCMSSALSEPGGAGLGTLGFHPALAKAMTAAAGFTQFRQYEFEEDTFNYFYEVRP